MKNAKANKRIAATTGPADPGRTLRSIEMKTTTEKTSRRHDAMETHLDRATIVGDRVIYHDRATRSWWSSPVGDLDCLAELIADGGPDPYHRWCCATTADHYETASEAMIATNTMTLDRTCETCGETHHATTASSPDPDRWCSYDCLPDMEDDR